MTFFTNTNIFTYFYLVLYLQLIRSEGAYKIQPARGTACTLSRLCPIFIMVCSTFYFSALQVVVLHCLELLFTRVHLHLFFFIWSCTSSWQDFQRLRKYYQLEVQLAYLIDFAQFSLQFALNFTFRHSIQSYTTLESFFFHEYLLVSWSCTSSWQDLAWLGKFYRLEVIRAGGFSLFH